MQSPVSRTETLRERLERDRHAIDTLLVDPRTDDQVLERLPNGELAWLRPEHPIRVVDDTRAHYAPEARFTITQQGRDCLARERAMQMLFDRPWPTVAEASA